MYKDKDKQREAVKQAQRRLRARARGYENKQKVSGYVYIIHCVGFPYYKIGMTTGVPIIRLAALQTSLPFELDLLAVGKTEDICRSEWELHARFDLWRQRGEWFMFGGETLRLAIEMIQDIDSKFMEPEQRRKYEELRYYMDRRELTEKQFEDKYHSTGVA